MYIDMLPMDSVFFVVVSNRKLMCMYKCIMCVCVCGCECIVCIYRSKGQSKERNICEACDWVSEREKRSSTGVWQWV